MILILLTLFFSLFSQPAFATDINVVCPNDPSSDPTSLTCSLTPNLPLFDETNIAPGFLTNPAKIISVDNQDDDNPCFLTAETIKTSGDDLLLTGTHRLNLSIISDSALLYSGPLIFDNLSLDKVDINSTRNYFWTVSFPQSAGNDYQQLHSVFDLNLIFSCIGGQTPDNPDPPPSPDPPSPPQCDDLVPATPSGLTATVSTLGGVNLSWNHVPQPYTSYLIAYGPDENTFLYGNPNIGLVNNYSVSGLTAGAQYCFYVRAQNGCMPGLPSDIVCINSGSTIPIVETSPPPGFQPDILGETTDIDASQQSDNINLFDIMGDSDQSCQFKYIPLFFILALLLNSLYFSKNPKGNIILPLLISLTGALIDWFILSQSCCLVASIFCKYFFIGSILSFILPRLVFRKKT
jgi:fibronectin type III domain protein